MTQFSISNNCTCSLTNASLFWFLLLLAVAPAAAQLRFSDVSVSAGIPRTAQHHYGGATVADLDGDGWLDVLLGAHTDPTTVLFNLRNGRFRSWRDSRLDAHGLTAFRRTPRDKSLLYAVSRGGFAGSRPNFPVLRRATVTGRVVRDPGTRFDEATRGRGRTILPVHMRHGDRRRPDLLVLNAYFPSFTTSPQRCVRMTGSWATLSSEPLCDTLSPGLVNDSNHFATITDIDNDGTMELITFHELRIYRLQRGRDYAYTDVTRQVLPSGARWLRAVRAVAEIDFDGDGYMDLYLSRSTNNDQKYLRSNFAAGQGPHDVLLRNVRGVRYEVYTLRAGVPRSGSEGVTAADFDNDGRVDLFVVRSGAPDIFLMNRGGGRFATIRSSSTGYTRPFQIPADEPVAADMDRDGRVDIIAAEGSWYSENGQGRRGMYKLLRNITPPSGNAWLLVRVRNAPGNGATSLHAAVTVCVGGGRTCARKRVAAPGVAVSVSYVDVVHFGLGSGVQRIASVSVAWVDGQVRTRNNVRSNTVIAIGAA